MPQVSIFRPGNARTSTGEPFQLQLRHKECVPHPSALYADGWDRTTAGQHLNQAQIWVPQVSIFRPGKYKFTWSWHYDQIGERSGRGYGGRLRGAYVEMVPGGAFEMSCQLRRRNALRDEGVSIAMRHQKAIPASVSAHVLDIVPARVAEGHRQGKRSSNV